MNKTSLTVAAIAAAGVSLALPALGQTDDNKLGTVHFETSCKPEAQKLFDRGMLYQHSFWYRASQKTFEDVLKADPECGIAYWGIALSLLWNPHAAPAAKNLAEGSAALAKAQSVGAKTERERDYLAALGAMYADYDKVDHRTRLLAYAKAMEQLAARYPNDDEAQIHYALALNTSASPADKTYANQLKGAAILEVIAKRQPQHPGVAHYLIHLYDYPPIADKGIEAARRYAKIAPDAPHALHMPSHIFTRVGYWQESIDSNMASGRSAQAAGDFHEELHAMDYLVYAYLQLGKDKKAGDVVEAMTTVTGFTETAPARSVCAGCFAGALRDRTRRLEGSGGARSPPQPAAPGAGDHLFCPRAWEPPARAIRPPPRPTSPSLAKCRTSSSRPRTPIGPGRSISRGRSRPPGSSTPKASATRRWQP